MSRSSLVLLISEILPNAARLDGKSVRTTGRISRVCVDALQRVVVLIVHERAALVVDATNLGPTAFPAGALFQFTGDLDVENCEYASVVSYLAGAADRAQSREDWAPMHFAHADEELTRELLRGSPTPAESVDSTAAWAPTGADCVGLWRAAAHDPPRVALQPNLRTTAAALHSNTDIDSNDSMDTGADNAHEHPNAQNTVLRARFARCVDGMDTGLYAQALRVRRSMFADPAADYLS